MDKSVYWIEKRKIIVIYKILGKEAGEFSEFYGAFTSVDTLYFALI